MKGFIVAAMFAVGFTVLIVILITANSDYIPVESKFFPAESAEHRYSHQVCGCKSDWALATDERNISNTYFAQSESIPDPRGLNTLAWVWGQFMAHELVHSKTNTSSPIYPLGELNLTRADSRVLENGCRESLSYISTAIDATTVYGDYLNSVDLRDGLGCKLQTSAGNLLPVVDSTTFLAGDVRNTENSLLNSMHVLWMREHNRLCTLLETRDPSKSQTDNYWKARQIVVAEIQHITYNEWLPALFGSQFGLLDTTVEKGENTMLTSEFSNAAFRFGHSMVGEGVGNFTLMEMFFNVSLMQEHGVEAFLEPALTLVAQKVDDKVVDGLRNAMFGAEDLVTRNLFRGRELGLGTYETVSQCYGTHNVSITHADSMHGMLSEPLVYGSSLPLTVATIVAEQFGRTRKYDLNFYTKIQEEIGFPYTEHINGTTMSRLIRDNTELKEAKDNAFYA